MTSQDQISTQEEKEVENKVPPEKENDFSRENTETKSPFYYTLLGIVIGTLLSGVFAWLNQEISLKNQRLILSATNFQRDREQIMTLLGIYIDGITGIEETLLDEKPDINKILSFVPKMHDAGLKLSLISDKAIAVKTFQFQSQFLKDIGGDIQGINKLSIQERAKIVKQIRVDFYNWLYEIKIIFYKQEKLTRPELIDDTKIEELKNYYNGEYPVFK